MSPPTKINHNICNVDIIPTYLSTDLITPGRRLRDTLPAIGFYKRSTDDPKLWGQETKPCSNGLLAYHRFKPSHLDACNVVVTHRHYSNRISNIVAKNQPVSVTSLMRSTCRVNDQRLPAPFQSSLIEERYIPEPVAFLPNSYFSHQCGFQLFPTSGVDMSEEDAVVKKPSTEDATIRNDAVEKIKSRLYDTTTYGYNFDTKQVKKRLGKSRKEIRFKLKLNTCRKCGLTRQPPTDQSKINLIESQKICTVRVQTGQKYNKRLSSGHTHREKKTNKHKKETFCKCEDQSVISNQSTDQIKSRDETSNAENKVGENNNTDESMRGNDKMKKVKATPRIFVSKESATNKTTNTGNKRDLNSLQDCYRESKFVMFHLHNRRPTSYECGMKTEAHRKFHRMYQDKIPDLRDATCEGRKHNFHGHNVHLFRG